MPHIPGETSKDLKTRLLRVLPDDFCISTVHRMGASGALIVELACSCGRQAPPVCASEHAGNEASTRSATPISVTPAGTTAAGPGPDPTTGAAGACIAAGAAARGASAVAGAVGVAAGGLSPSARARAISSSNAETRARRAECQEHRPNPSGSPRGMKQQDGAGAADIPK